METCKFCGRIVGKVKPHSCPTNIWNKGLTGVQTAWNKGLELSEETKKKMSEAAKGRSAYNKGMKGAQMAWNKGIHRNLNPNGSFKKGHNIGEKNTNWKGGISSKRDLQRQRQEIKAWRNACFKRDNWTCQKYGVRSGGLTVHHIYNFSEHIELQTDIGNGITLSKKAHKEFHDKYGYRKNSLEQLQEFLAVKIKMAA